MASENHFKEIFGADLGRHMSTKVGKMCIFSCKCFQDILRKMVCEEPSRDCHMSMCDNCKPLALALKDKVKDVFLDLEIEEVRV